MSELNEEQKTITFGSRELDPSEAATYKAKVAAARSGVGAVKGSTPVGHVPRPTMPILQAERTSELPSGLTETGGVAPRPAGSPAVRPETLHQISEAQKVQQDISQKDIEAATKEELEDKQEQMLEDIFELRNPGLAVDRILNNKKRRRDIESRCDPMKFDDLLLKGEVRQLVPIIPHRFEVRFRSMLPEENLLLKEVMSKDDNINDAHTVEKFNLLQLACAVVSVNGEEIAPSWPQYDKNGRPDEAVLTQRFKKVQKMSGYIVQDLSINYFWFDIRVRKLISPDALGNT